MASDTYQKYSQTKAYTVASTMQALIACGRGFENLRNKYQPGQRFAIQPAVDCDPINHRERYSDVENMHKCAVGYTLGGNLASISSFRKRCSGPNACCRSPMKICRTLPFT